MNGSELFNVNHEKDLGITFSNDLKLSKRYSDIVKTAYKLVSFIEKTFEYKSEKVTLHPSIP